MIGTRLAHYEIISHLGTGGMGEVYRALDTKLGRNVAVKLLPVALASNAERLSRFRREAQVLASLNHPNIAQIYGIEETVDAPCSLSRVCRLSLGESLGAAADSSVVCQPRSKDALGKSLPFLREAECEIPNSPQLSEPHISKVAGTKQNRFSRPTEERLASIPDC
jgi:serine/threonine protein kinase